MKEKAAHLIEINTSHGVYHTDRDRDRERERTILFHFCDSLHTSSGINGSMKMVMMHSETIWKCCVSCIICVEFIYSSPLTHSFRMCRFEFAQRIESTLKPIEDSMQCNAIQNTVHGHSIEISDTGFFVPLFAYGIIYWYELSSILTLWCSKCWFVILIFIN